MCDSGVARCQSLLANEFDVLYYWFTCCIENSVALDQLDSSEAIGSGSTLLIELMSGFILLFESVKCLSTERYKLICTIRQVKFSLDKYIMAIYLSLDK